MSLEFNRRSFLKYSAAAAVAVAGSSLLTGCGEDEYQKTGKIGSTLKLMGTFKMYEAAPRTAHSGKSLLYCYGKFTCTINIKCTTDKVPLCVTRANFELTVNAPARADEADYLHESCSVTVDPSGKYDLTADDGEKISWSLLPALLLSFV